MLDEKFTEINDDIKDAVGEITNMISGDARKRLEAEGFKITAAIPTVISGKDHETKHVLRDRVLSSHLKSTKVLLLSICVWTKGENAWAKS